MDILEKIILKQRTQVEQLEKELNSALMKLAGMTEMLALIHQQKAIHDELPMLNKKIPSNISFQLPESEDENIKNKPRRLSPQWKGILKFIGKLKIATLNDIHSFAPHINRKLIRTQLSYYISRAWVLRDENTGKFSLTEAGEIICEIDKPDSYFPIKENNAVEKPSP